MKFVFFNIDVVLVIYGRFEVDDLSSSPFIAHAQFSIKYACHCQFYCLTYDFFFASAFLCYVAKLEILPVDLKYPKRKKSYELMSGLCAGQDIPQSVSSRYHLDTTRETYRVKCLVQYLMCESHHYALETCFVMCTLF